MNQRALVSPVPESGVPLLNRGELPFLHRKRAARKRISTLQRNNKSFVITLDSIKELFLNEVHNFPRY